MTTEEAVRIVREVVIPWESAVGRDALETVLTGLAEQSKRADDWFAKAETLVAERDEARRDLTASNTTQGILQLQHSTMRSDCDNWKRRAEQAERERDEAQAECREHSERAQHFMRRYDEARAEVERLKAQTEQLWNKWSETCESLAAERERSERLREALEWIRENYSANGAGMKARAVLAPAQPEPYLASTSSMLICGPDGYTKP